MCEDVDVFLEILVLIIFILIEEGVGFEIGKIEWFVEKLIDVM